LGILPVIWVKANGGDDAVEHAFVELAATAGMKVVWGDWVGFLRRLRGASLRGDAFDMFMGQPSCFDETAMRCAIHSSMFDSNHPTARGPKEIDFGNSPLAIF